MKKTLLSCACLSLLVLAGCTTTNSINCPEWSEYWENTYDNGKLESQGCFEIDSDVMQWHWIYYFENGWKDMEWDMVNDLEQWKWTFYDEEWNNIVVMEWYYKDGLEDGKWTYYYDDWEYLCSETYSEWEVTDEWDCEYDHEYEEEILEEEVVEQEEETEVESQE